MQILRVHGQDDGDKEGKRIASEANRRYILTPAVTGGSSGGAGVGDKGSAAAGTGNICIRCFIPRSRRCVLVLYALSLCWARADVPRECSDGPVKQGYCFVRGSA